jgi:FkbM family methyltransferase
MQMPGSDERKLIEVDSIFGRIGAFADDLATDQIVAFGAHTRPELAFLLSMVDTGDSVFDLGGHIGTFAIPLARKIGPEGRIVIVEGLPMTCALLERNVRRNVPTASVAIVNALIARAGYCYAAHTPQGNTGANFFGPATDGNVVRVPTTTIDELCHAHFFPRVLKIDIEGSEVVALSGAPALLARHPIIYAEIADQLLRRNGSTVDELEVLLRANGYRYFKNVGDRNAAHDDFVVVELPNLSSGGEFFDVLAVHREDERIERVLTRTTG